MRHTELATVLRAAAPWWSRRRRSSWVLDDPELAARAAHGWAPAARTAQDALGAPADLRAGSLTLVLGPRGTGKTTAVKDLVARVVAEPDVDPRAVVLVPVEPDVSVAAPDRPVLRAEDVDEVLRRPTRTGAPACDGERLFVVDEVGGVPGWTEPVLGAVRRGARVVVTASAAQPDDVTAVQAWPGARVVRLQPASFTDLLMACPQVPPAVVRDRFLVHGGLPRAIAEHRDTGAVSASFVDRLVAGLERDLRPTGLLPAGTTVERLLDTLCATTGRFVEPAALAARLTISSEQAAALVRRLVGAGVLDPRRGLVDPLLHRLPSLRDPGTFDPPSTTHLADASC
ncbi:AAA family ATPase [Cellulomonas sp. SLBN-39]|uniref:AAA family ATPase n=1 Tax=Cellulomonas sp. SLBN-39 TaxID=2768446 RepID=UPI00116F7A6C|nr:AAA family ATPase [Cellulomonas sp. SLBN-39]TQL02991.1 AAA domain-containing protein [Cellulomonas sp. SLBN-39]